MKKTFKTFALMLLTALALGSCVDVPAPYTLPDKGSNTGGGGSGTIEGTPVSCAQAVELTKALADGATSTETYTITGYITDTDGTVSRNQQIFWMADTKNGGKVFEAYWANLPDGVEVFKLGMKVKITGKLMKYVNANNGNVICEMKNPIVTILEDDGGDTPPVEDGISVTCAEAAELTNALADSESSTSVYTVTGYITEVVGEVSTKTGSPQQTFWMADTKDGGRIFEAYYANLPNGVSAFVKGTKVKITGKLYKFVNSGRVTCEIKNPSVVILEDGGGETPPPVVEDGIPVTCTHAAELTQALADNGTTSETYTVTGYITEVIGDVSTKTGTPQQRFWMADSKDGGQVLQAYYANLPTGVSAFVVGMKVTLTGKLCKFVSNGTVIPEIKNGTVVVLEQGDGGNIVTPVEDGIPVTCAEAADLTRDLADNGTSTETYTVTGYITEVIGDVSTKTGTPQQRFWMADTKDGGQVLQAYYANLPTGVSAFVVGTKVTLTGKLYKFLNSSTGETICEIKNGTVVILEDGDGGDTPLPPTPDTGTTVTELVNGDFEEWVSDAEPLGWKSASSASNSNVGKSDAVHGGSFSCLVHGDTEGNRRLATQEITLAAGTYTFSYYAKAASSAGQTKCGFVPVTINNGEYKVGSYKYSAVFNLNDSEWTLVSYEFTLNSETTVCLVVMNPRNSGNVQDILVDDATLVKQ